RVAGAARQDDDSPFLQMADRPPADIRLGDMFHAHGGQETGLAGETLQGVLQSKAVKHGCEHGHVVGGGFLGYGCAGTPLGAAEGGVAADNNGELHAALDHALHLPRHADRLVDAYAALAAMPEALAAQLENDAAVFGVQTVSRVGIAHGWPA